jgi:Protein phosphatase inhibitor 2 (IPP-2)
LLAIYGPLSSDPISQNISRHGSCEAENFTSFHQCRDEDNLEENERIKKELNPRKIDEPKTPYLSPQATEDEAEMLGKKQIN